MNAYNFYTVSSYFFLLPVYQSLQTHLLYVINLCMVNWFGFVQGCDFPEKIVIMIIGKRLSNNTLEEKLKSFGVKLKVEGN